MDICKDIFVYILNIVHNKVKENRRRKYDEKKETNIKVEERTAFSSMYMHAYALSKAYKHTVN